MNYLRTFTTSAEEVINDLEDEKFLLSLVKSNFLQSY